MLVNDLVAGLVTVTVFGYVYKKYAVLESKTDHTPGFNKHYFIILFLKDIILWDQIGILSYI